LAILKRLHLFWLANLQEKQSVSKIYNCASIQFDLKAYGTRPAHDKTTAPSIPGHFLKLDEMMSLHIQRALKMTNGRIHGPDGAAELLGINPSTLRSRIKKLGITN